MVEQAPVETPDKPKEAPVKNDEPPALGTNLKGPGPGMSGLGGTGNGGGTGTGGGRNGNAISHFAGVVQRNIQKAIENNRKTRKASMQVTVKIWPDETGRITRAVVSGTSGDRDVDLALQNEVLTGLRLEEPPPKGLPRPVVMRLSATRPK